MNLKVSFGRYWPAEKYLSDAVLVEILVALAILQMVLAGLARPAGILQGPIEIALILGFGLSLFRSKLDKTDKTMFVVLILVSAPTLIFSPADVAIVNFKQNLIAALALMAFPKMERASVLIVPLLVLTVFLTFVSPYEMHLTDAMAAYSQDPDFNNSRFGGVFLNAHFNAMFIACCFLSFKMTRTNFLAALVSLYLAAVKFVSIAYIAQMIFNGLRRRISNRKIIYIGIISACFVVLTLSFFDPSEFVNRKYFNSLYIILIQLTDVEYYKNLLHLIPGEYFQITPSRRDEAQLLIEATERCNCIIPPQGTGNSIGYFALATQMGLPLALLFVFSLCTRSKRYIVLILVSLVHNVLFISPLIIYLMVSYARSDRVAENSN